MRYVFKAISWALIVCLTHNPVAVFYMATGLLFFRPLPAIADAFLDRAAEGQAFGTELMTGFSIPSVNSSTGETTLNNGLAAGEKIQQNGLFQEIQPGSMDGIAASYGDAATFGTQVNNGLGTLSTGGSTHAQAYQTLMGANTSMPNLYNDPLWKQSDDVYTRTSPLIDDLFNGCEKKTSFSEKSCPVHLEDLKTCKKTLKSESCTVTRVITELTGNQKAINKVSASSTDNPNEIVFNDLTSNINIQLGIPWNHDAGSSGCYFWEYTIVIHVNDPSRLISALMTYVAADGGMSLFIDGSQLWDGNGGYASCPDGSWDSSPNFDILPYLTQGQHTLTMRIAADNNDTPSIPDGGARFVIKKKPDFKEDFQDFPAGCRARILAGWPPDGAAPAFVSTGSLVDQASTDWWQCTDAATSRTVGTTVITNTPDIAPYLAPILPDPPATPPAPICYKAETRVPGHITLPCFTDKDGYQVCPEYDYNLDEHNSCGTLTANPQCAYVGESCAEGAISPVTGSCQEFIVTYDCGTDHQASCAQVNDGEKTICDSAIRCMGGECVDQPTESNKGFIKAATALQTLNQAQQSNGCSATTGDCALFAGERMECQMADLSVLGAVDCCNMPIAGSWIDYMMLAANTWELADTSVEAYAMAEYGGGYMTADFGAWNLVASDTVFSAPIGTITDTWNAITEPFTSMYDSVASMLSEQIGTDLGIEAIKQQIVQWLGEWVASTFGETAAATLLTASTTGAGAAATTTYTMAGSMLSSIVTVVGIVYAIYQIAKMVVQLIFACTEQELELNMLKSQRLCTSSGEIGNYCSAKVLYSCVARKEAYCCFSSPFARIFQQQARPQLGMSFGQPKSPSCEGLNINQIGNLDFDKMDFSEWIGMMKLANQLPIDSAAAQAMYDKANVTKGKLQVPGAHYQNAQERLDAQTQGTDIDAIRQHLLDNL